MQLVKEQSAALHRRRRCSLRVNCMQQHTLRSCLLDPSLQRLVAPSDAPERPARALSSRQGSEARRGE